MLLFPETGAFLAAINDLTGLRLGESIRLKLSRFSLTTYDVRSISPLIAGVNSETLTILGKYNYSIQWLVRSIQVGSAAGNAGEFSLHDLAGCFVGLPA